MVVNRMEKALMGIDAIVEAYNTNMIKITTERNGYNGDTIGLDVIMAIVRNYVIYGLCDPLERKGGYLYV